MKRSAIKQIEDLVNLVAQESAERGPDARLDALKILGPFYALLKKAQIKAGDEEGTGETTMLEIQRRLNAGKTIQQDYEDQDREH